MSQDLEKTKTAIDLLLDNITDSIKDRFVTYEFKKIIEDTVKNFFPQLNDQDLNLIKVLTIFMVDLISFKYSFDPNNKDYFLQWMQNDNRDIKGVILLLLPFIDDKNNGHLLKKITDLNQLLYSPKGKKYVEDNIKDLERTNSFLSTYFEFGNMGIGLLGLDNSKPNGLLDLYPNRYKLIYDIIHHNFIGLIKTLEIINGKCYVNWVNISPLNLNNYYDSKLFSSTKEGVSTIFNILNLPDVERRNRFDKFEKTMMIGYSGLWVGNLYNIIRIKYYEEAKPIKWLIFPYEVSDKNQIYLIQGLNKIFNLDEIIGSKYSNFNDLNHDDKFSFKRRFKEIIETLLEGASVITGLINIDIDIIKYLIIYLVNNYSNKKKIKSKNIKKFEFETENQDEKTDDFDKKDMDTINKLTQKDIVDCLKDLYSNSIDHVWNYLKESIEMLNNSPYGKFLIKDNKIVDSYYYEPFNSKFKETDEYKNNVKSKLNFKNIYNIAKSLSHDSSSSWKLLDENYMSLNTSTKINYFLKIQSKLGSKTWINLNSNFKRQILYQSFNYNQELKKILDAFKDCLLVLVFEELASTGLLNKFEPNVKITDRMLLPKDTGPKKAKRKELMKELFKKNNDNWLDSFYYLTNDKFRNLGKIRVDKSEIVDPKNKYKEESYFDFTKDQEWAVFYAMDWISQISFFQHYIYHQVLYVTGATGQGKSTQVPKLLLYALKAIDNKSNGKVACTQPRVPPTVENATRIAFELGVPIQQTTNNSAFKTKTSNYWVQYKHQKDFHTNDKKLHGYLRIMTDGTLLEELKSNPTMFKKVPGQKEDKFINKTIYDIIIVDEAHEHNINMDLIITLSKQACYFNNKVKLIIVSATMDDDEPIYRRYFSMINDNLMYPIKAPISHPFSNDNNFLPIPEYMDRRYHISPPGETTQYRVDEIYLDNDIIYKGNKPDEKSIAKEAQELGYKKVLEICAKSPNGEILFFANGKKEIQQATEYLNTNLPPENIALPYFAELNETYKDIISKIDVKISQIKNKREKIHLEWDAKYVEDPSVPSGIYKRAIIIATNVAEASVTIPRLAFVIDNGYSKVKSYNVELNIEKLGIQKISESSRIQRRGRVGRIGDGTVYYMYKKDARKEIKPKYKITQEDLAGTILGLLSNKELVDVKKIDIENYEKLIVSGIINPNIFDGTIVDNTKNNQRKVFKTFNNKLEDVSNHYTVKSGLLDIYMKNYWINGQPPNQYYWSVTNPKTVNSTFFVLKTGQTILNLLDEDGDYYLIHPFENSIKRNVLNEIIEHGNRQSTRINLGEYRYILSYLFSYGAIIDFNAELLYNYENEIVSRNRNWVKSELGEQISELSSKLQTKIPDAITLISASAMNCLTEVLEIKIFLEVLGNSMKNLVTIQDFTWNNFKSIYANAPFNSDLIFIYEIIKKIKVYFSDLFVFTTNQPNTKVMLDQHFDSVIKKFKKLSDTNNETPVNFDGVLWNKLSTLKNNGKLESGHKEILLTDASTIKKFNKNSFNTDRISKWANSNYLNSFIITEFIKKLGEFYLSKVIFEDNSVLEWASKFNSNYMKLLTTGTIEERIIRSFIYGKPYQFTYSLVKSGPPYSLMNYQVIPVKFTNETLTNLSNQMVFYINYSLEAGEYVELSASILNKVDLDWIIPAIPMFINPRMVPNIISVGEEKELIFPNSEYIERIKRTMINNWNKNKILWYSDTVPIMNMFYNKITKIISTNNKI